MPELVRGNFLPAQWEALSHRTKAEILEGCHQKVMAGAWALCSKLEFTLREAITRDGITCVMHALADIEHGALIQCRIYIVDADNANLEAVNIIEPWDTFPSEFAQTQILLITGAVLDV